MSHHIFNSVITQNESKELNVDFIIATSRDPWGSIAGGKCRFVQHLLSLPTLSAAVVSNSYNPDLPVGCWLWANWKGKSVAFFNLGVCSSSSQRPLIPLRLVTWYRYRRFAKKIRDLNCQKVFIDTPEVFPFLATQTWESVCYCFGGVNNPLVNSRFWWGRRLSAWFMRRFYRTLGNSKSVLLASADQNAIDRMRKEAEPWLNGREIVPFPTRVDCAFFRPCSSKKSAKYSPVLAACGRLTAIKGWRFLLDVLVELRRTLPEARLLWIGDGDEREAALKCAQDLGIAGYFVITGMVGPDQIRDYLHSSSAGVVGSVQEGWSLAMLEMLASGLPLVSTEVSGAHDLIESGRNGFVVSERDPVAFASALIRTLDLKEAEKYSLAIAARYDSGPQLEQDLRQAWPALSM